MTATPSNRQQILEALRARVCEIRLTNEFQTDAGKTVFVNETPTLGPDDPDTAVAIVVGDDAPGYQGEQIMIRLPIHFLALAKATLEHPWRAAEAVLADLKKAIELPDRTLDGLVRRQLERSTTRTLERQEGSTVVGVALTYDIPYLETWGFP